MADELVVKVTQEPGTVTWNFDQLKTSLSEIMQTYETIAYTDETIQEAKKDVASLRKLRDAVDSKRLEIRRKCLEPYNVIEAQAKELTKLIDRPISAINGQIKEYEDARRAEKKKEIMTFMKESFSDLPEAISGKLIFKAYNPSWENVSTSKKVWAGAIGAAHDQTASDLKIINGIQEEEFREVAMKAYENNLILSDALNGVQAYREQREAILKREQARREAEEKRREQERLAAEAAEQKPAPENQTAAAPETDQNAMKPQTEQPKQDSGIMEKVICIRGDRKQLARIFGYIKYVGAEYEEV